MELVLTYSERFFHRQFITRKITNHKILNRLEEILDEYFGSDKLLQKGLPTVQFIAGALNVSPNYLSDLLKVLTGQSTQQHIHDKLIEKAKEKLSTTDLSVSEIAYELGFEHPQSFSKLFKTKTSQSPLEFRHSFN
jgi:AraC-like DNA-binding protein